MMNMFGGGISQSSFFMPSNTVFPMQTTASMPPGFGTTPSTSGTTYQTSQRNYLSGYRTTDSTMLSSAAVADLESQGAQNIASLSTGQNSSQFYAGGLNSVAGAAPHANNVLPRTPGSGTMSPDALRMATSSGTVGAAATTATAATTVTGTARWGQPLDRYDNVVQSLYGEDAYIRDVSGLNVSVDGQLDSYDRIIYRDDNGVLKSQKIGATEIYEIKNRTANVENSYRMYNKMWDGNVTFGDDMENQYYNEDYWKPVYADGAQYWMVKDNVTPANAIRDVFNRNGGAYSIDCAASSNLVMLKSKLDTIGDKDFNDQYSNMAIRGWDVWSKPFGGSWQLDDNGALDYVDGDRNQWGSSDNLTPGDWVYFTNPYVQEGGGAEQGENCMFLGYDYYGDPLFFGNPVGIFSGEACDYGYLSTLVGGADPSLLKQMDRYVQRSFG